MLCNECENIIEKYEKYGLSIFRNTAGSLEVCDSGDLVYKSHSYNLFKLFVTSLIWRASVSRQKIFEIVLVPPNLREEARVSLYQGQPLAPHKLGSCIYKIIDASQHNQRLSQEHLRNMIMSPIMQRPKEGFYSIIWVMEGFLIKTFIPSIPPPYGNRVGMHKDQDVLYIPRLCISEVPELEHMLEIPANKKNAELVRVIR